MYKSVEDVMKEIKGEGNENALIAGKSPFSQSSFDTLVHSLVNDTTHKIPQYDPKTGEKIGEVNISELIRGDLQKTVADAKYPQKSEADVLLQGPDKNGTGTEIATKGLSQAFSYILMEQLSTGKKFPLPPQPEMVASISIGDVPASHRTIPIRDPQTQKDLGTAEITTQSYKQLKAHSPAPEHKKETKRIPPK